MHGIEELSQYKLEEPKVVGVGGSMIGYFCPECKHTEFLVFQSSSEENNDMENDAEGFEEFNGEEDLHDEMEREREDDDEEGDLD